MRKALTLTVIILLFAMVSCARKSQTSSYQKGPQEQEFEKKVQAMIDEKKNLDGMDDGETPPLVLAALSGYIDSARILIKHGANVEIKENIARISPLHGAVRGPEAKRPDKNEQDMIKLLLDNKATVDSVDKMGNTPLSKAARGGRLEAVTMLTDAGADIKHVNGSGLQPIHLASETGYHETVDFFIKKGADVNQLTTEGRTCLDLTSLKMMQKQYDEARKTNKDAYAGADYDKTIELLKKAGAKTGDEINPKKKKPAVTPDEKPSVKKTPGNVNPGKTTKPKKTR